MILLDSRATTIDFDSTVALTMHGLEVGVHSFKLNYMSLGILVSYVSNL